MSLTLIRSVPLSAYLRDGALDKAEADILDAETDRRKRCLLRFVWLLHVDLSQRMMVPSWTQPPSFARSVCFQYGIARDRMSHKKRRPAPFPDLYSIIFLPRCPAQQRFESEKKRQRARNKIPELFGVLSSKRFQKRHKRGLLSYIQLSDPFDQLFPLYDGGFFRPVKKILQGNFQRTANQLKVFDGNPLLAQFNGTDETL